MSIEKTTDTKDITVVIKTILRYKVCRKTVAAFRELFPESEIIVVDDTPLDGRQEIEGDNVRHVTVDRDLGASEGRNMGIGLATTDLVYVSDDDAPPVDMSPCDIHKVVDLMRTNQVDLVGWQGCMMKEMRRRFVFSYVEVTEEFQRCDATQISFLARREALLLSPFVNEIRNNKEHGALFVGWKRSGLTCAASSLLQFNNLQTRNHRYRKRRKRKDPESIQAKSKYLGGKKIVWKAPNYE